MKQIQFIFPFLLGLSFINYCGAKTSLIQTNIQKIKSSSNQTKLKTGVYNGCEGVPAKNIIQRWMVGFKFTGHTCSVNIHSDQTISTSLIGSKAYLISEIKGSDIFIAPLENDNEILIIQHHNGNVVSVSHRTYDTYNTNGNLNFGRGDYLKQCFHFNGTGCSRN